MTIYKNKKKLKNELHKSIVSFKRFNEWEKQLHEKPDIMACLLAVFELYDMIPERAKNRAVKVEGIMKMRKGLACLA